MEKEIKISMKVSTDKIIGMVALMGEDVEKAKECLDNVSEFEITKEMLAGDKDLQKMDVVFGCIMLAQLLEKKQ